MGYLEIARRLGTADAVTLDMPMQIAYYYRKSVMDTREGAAHHDEIRDLLSRLRAKGHITDYVVQDTEIAFPTKQAEEDLFSRLRDFAARHKVGLARPFGSRRHSFCYLPQQFLLVYEGTRLKEVFPCEIGDRDQVEPFEFLSQITTGRPWTVRSASGMEGKRHKALIAQILSKPDRLEAGLMIRGQNVQVSQDFGELGFIDLVFEDSDGHTLLVEVKVGPNELDKAIGQIMRHRYLFARQNRVDETSIRMAIACPSIPTHYRSICAEVGITCFEIPEMLGLSFPASDAAGS
jgi:hypothetical protein